MKLQNIIKIISAIFGVLAVVFLFRIIGLGDEEIKMAASMGDYGSVSPLVNLAIAILVITVAVTLVFSLIGLTSDAKKLKKALLSAGLFLAVIGISYAMSTGVETPLKDGEVLSASGSRWVGAGLRAFYILAVVAIGAMLMSGAKRIFNK
jgi:protein-S-isoprenylcysteine O-methyltransferase Ste14